MIRLAILISNSGTGTNLQAIIDAIENKTLKARIVTVISDKKDAYGLTRAGTHHIPTAICLAKEQLLPLLQAHKPDYVCLTGWKLIIPNDVLTIYSQRILNIHPGLIPDTIQGIVKNPDGTEALWNKGKFTDTAIQNFLTAKATYAGSTVHFLSNEFDFGPVLGRCFEKIQPNDTAETLYARLKKKENHMYVQTLKKLCNT
ncbi:MAG: hypothetical protein HY430_01375 [Candidatus Levybacteria bacterium]|nr:hypothetical protein [Candidatus Levybacteria bacterium]